MLPFEKKYNIISTISNEFKTQKLTYKYFNTYKREQYSYEEVYKFSKHDIKHLINLFSDSCKTISLYVIQNNDIKHQIFYLSTDQLGNTIKKEKFTEDIEINPPFDIYFQVEIINMPIQFTSNTPRKILRPTFKIKCENTQTTAEGIIKKIYIYTQNL